MSLLSNAKWVSLSQFGRIIIQLISLTVLTRFIPPADYGLMALGTVVMNFVFIIRDLGTASAIIQRKEVDDDILNSVFWLNVTMGVGLCILIILCTPLIELLFKNEKLDNI
ncbi:TPA: oligosaccharide flippase family protein, partial [Escherichia coli]|nr:oligosaccharide flippase family protein [Escherichia coli]